ncbi:hypothetical protein [Hirschia maritima]|uniref:hypothetical protein n=1 Tax=Hirschia maritima TaxID=1121961 RepID=UPI00037CC053|nr:hypothetical protein [Hirschia maritima]
MALFFDYEWFDDRLKSLGLGRDSLARNSGMTVDEIDMIFDDRRAISVSEIHSFADTLSVNPEIIAKYCGVSDLALETRIQETAGGPESGIETGVSREMIMGLHERIDRVEQLLEMVLTKLDARG